MLEIIPDPIHVALLTLPFLVAVVGSWLILWRPLSAYLDERRTTVLTARKEAAELEEAAEEQLDTLEGKLAEARERVLAIHTEARARAADKEAAILQTAREDAEEVVADALTTINAEREAASKALEASAQELSHDIAGRVLGRSVA